MKKIKTLTGEHSFENRSFSKDEILEITASKRVKGLDFTNCPITDDDVFEIAKMPQLVNVCLYNTAITDKAIEYLSQIPNLMHLYISEANLNGQGFKSFLDHKKLQSISVDNSKFDDEGLKIIAKIPKLNFVKAENTLISFEGLMSIANNPRLKVFAPDLFSDEQMELFEKEQRNLLKKKTTVNAEDEKETKKLLFSFFDAMTEWEKFAEKNDFSTETQFKCRDLFEKYCTDKPRGGFRPDGLSYSMEPFYSYTSHKVVDVEQLSKNKVYIYTKDHNKFQFRFIFLRRKNRWWIDERQWHDGGWKRYGL